MHYMPLYIYIENELEISCSSLCTSNCIYKFYGKNFIYNNCVLHKLELMLNYDNLYVCAYM